MSVDLTTVLAGVAFPNPVFTASGCAAAGRELDPFCDPAGLGAVVTKSVLLHPRAGRPTPRLAETPAGLLNSIGLQGPGVAVLRERDLPWLAERGARAVVSVAGGSPAEFAAVTEALSGAPALVALEVNISCPNVSDRGQVFARDPAAAAAAVAAVRSAAPAGVPVFAKLSPDVTDIVAVARACVGAGADGLSLINTLLGVAIDTRTLRPALAAVTGGLSGPAVKPVALRCVWEVHQALPAVPLIGMGGVRDGLDALEFLAAGASAVAVGTAIFHDPTTPARVRDQLAGELAARGVRRVADVVGVAHRPAVSELPAAPDPPGARAVPTGAGSGRTVAAGG